MNLMERKKIISAYLQNQTDELLIDMIYAMLTQHAAKYHNTFAKEADFDETEHQLLMKVAIESRVKRAEDDLEKGHVHTLANAKNYFINKISD